ncbi:MAG TPA: glycine cleavage system protein GcvH [Anaerolineae bacterium]|nr:glycine cleavage system protein GcvH [Anaerolineae bacterium]
MDFPSDLKYTESDEWIRVEGEKGTIGITDYAQDQLSDIVYVEVLAALGASLEKGAVFAAVESVKAAADIYMPVGGKIVEVNESLADTPEMVNTDPYGEAWLVRIELADASELDALKDAAAYEKSCEERSH